MIRRSLLLLITVASLAVPLAAAAPVLAQNSFQQPVTPLVSPTDNSAPPPTTSSSSDAGNGGGLSHFSEILMAIGGAALITFIGWAIVRDARRAAPVAEDGFAADGPREGGARHAARARSKARRRARTKAQRAARRHNR